MLTNGRQIEPCLLIIVDLMIMITHNAYTMQEKEGSLETRSGVSTGNRSASKFLHQTAGVCTRPVYSTVYSSRPMRAVHADKRPEKAAVTMQRSVAGCRNVLVRLARATVWREGGSVHSPDRRQHLGSDRGLGSGQIGVLGGVMVQPETRGWRRVAGCSVKLEFSHLMIMRNPRRTVAGCHRRT